MLGEVSKADTAGNAALVNEIPRVGSLDGMEVSTLLTLLLPSETCSDELIWTTLCEPPSSSLSSKSVDRINLSGADDSSKVCPSPSAIP